MTTTDTIEQNGTTPRSPATTSRAPKDDRVEVAEYSRIVKDWLASTPAQWRPAALACLAAAHKATPDRRLAAMLAATKDVAHVKALRAILTDANDLLTVAARCPAAGTIHDTLSA